MAKSVNYIVTAPDNKKGELFTRSVGARANEQTLLGLDGLPVEVTFVNLGSRRSLEISTLQFRLTGSETTVKAAVQRLTRNSLIEDAHPEVPRDTRYAYPSASRAEARPGA